MNHQPFSRFVSMEKVVIPETEIEKTRLIRSMVMTFHKFLIGSFKNNSEMSREMRNTLRRCNNHEFIPAQTIYDDKNKPYDRNALTAENLKLKDQVKRIRAELIKKNNVSDQRLSQIERLRKAIDLTLDAKQKETLKYHEARV